MDGGDDKARLTKQEAYLLETFHRMDEDCQYAMVELSKWLVARPKDEEFSHAEAEGMLEKFRLEHIRRRLGGKVGEILQFTKPNKSEEGNE